ncbi:MAG TPA: hypothetical protein VM144_17925 [Aestuariivirga sp.]|nr:hypothetical protein [Aestuariivirga sp.]
MWWLGSAIGRSRAPLWLLPLGVVVAGFCVPALAADWSLKFGASQSLTLDDNIDLEEDNRDTALMSSTAFDLDLLALGKTYKIELMPRVSFQKTFFSEEPDDWSYFPSGTLLLSKWTKRTTYDLVATYARSEASSNELVDGVFTEDEGDQLSYAVTGTITNRVNHRNTLIWSNALNLVDYTLPSDDLVPSLTATSTGTWRREMSELVTGNLTGSVQYYEPDSPTLDSRLLYRATVGATARLSKRLTVTAAAGGVFLDPENDSLTADVIWNVAADYKLKTTNYTFSAARDLSPSQDGTLDDTYSARLGVSHQVNDMLSIALSSSYVLQRDEEGDSSAFIVSPSLNYQLSRDWTSSLSYRYIETEDEIEEAYSNAVTLTLSYGTYLIP